MRFLDSLLFSLLLSMPLHSQHIEWILKNERHTVQRIRLPEFPMAAFGRKDDDTASVFAVAENLPRPDMRPYAEAYALLLRSLPFRRTTLYIRSDEWFILQSSFPVQGPFHSAAEPPPQEAFDRTGTVYCNPFKTEDVCVGVGLGLRRR